MKPYVICHMGSSVDGRTLLSRWRPKGSPGSGLYESLHEELQGDAWLIGRVTGQEFAKAASYPREGSERFPRQSWIAHRNAGAYGIVLDAHGKIAWGRAEVGGDPIVTVLTKQVADGHLAGLRADGVSYLFGGERQIDLGLTLEVLNRELGIGRLLLEGGGTTNGAFLRAGLVDELSLIVFPTLDGAKGAPSVFDSAAENSAAPAPIESMTLESCKGLAGGAVWLRYRLGMKPGGQGVPE